MKNYNLPEKHEPFTDKYFLRSKEILEAERLNPYVRAQLFIRKGPGRIYGINEALAIIEKYSNLTKNNGKVFALREGTEYAPKETLMVIEGHVQDIITLETMCLGVITAETTKVNDRTMIDLTEVTQNMTAVVEAAKGRLVYYFGARHWRFDEDEAIAKAAFKGGAIGASTDIGAATAGKTGVGTIPHALENIYAWTGGYEEAVLESTKAFDKVIDPAVPRIALIDYANKEIDDSIATANALEGRLYAVRVDTCGENIMQEAIAKGKHKNAKYWFRNGVSISGVYALRKALNKAGHENVKIMLSSGFGDAEKVKAFTDAEKELGLKIYDSLGVGGIFYARIATMDIVGVGEADNILPISKVGRPYNPNPRLEQVLGGR